MGLLSKCYKAGLVRSKEYFHQSKCLLVADAANVAQPFLPKKWSKGKKMLDIPPLSAVTGRPKEFLSGAQHRRGSQTFLPKY